VIKSSVFDILPVSEHHHRDRIVAKSQGGAKRMLRFEFAAEVETYIERCPMLALILHLMSSS
jgi:hypothetical protein